MYTIMCYAIAEDTFYFVDNNFSVSIVKLGHIAIVCYYILQYVATKQNLDIPM